MRFVAWVALFAPAAALSAQDWEAGASAGIGLVRGVFVSSARAGFSNAPAFGAYLGQEVSRHVGGEVSYTFRPGDLRLNAGGSKVTFGGQSHLVHYDLLIYSAPTGAAIRPFLSGGGGVRLTRGTGQESAYQPLMEYALLTRTWQVQPLVNLGAGFKVRVSNRLHLRVEVRDFVSPFPSRVIAPAPGLKPGGWLHDIVPLAGLSCSF